MRKLLQQSVNARTKSKIIRIQLEMLILKGPDKEVADTFILQECAQMYHRDEAELCKAGSTTGAKIISSFNQWLMGSV